MIRHFFADKEGLFAATIADRTEIPDRMAAAFAGDPERIGHRLANAYLDLWEEPDTGPMLRAMVRTALSSPAAAGLIRELIAGRIVGGIGGGDPDLALRAALVGSHLLGLASARYLIEVEPVAAIARDDLVEAAAPTLKRYLTEPIPGRGTPR